MRRSRQSIGRCPRLRRRQEGAALLALLAVVVLAGAAIVLERANQVAAAARQGDTGRSVHTLSAARDALLAWAVLHSGEFAGERPPLPEDLPTSYRDVAPGLFPCPDVDDDGWPDPPCTAGGTGRLPWRLLGAGDLRDGSSERLWYAVAGNFAVHNGVATAGSGDALLVDASRDFIGLGVQAGDAVQGLGLQDENRQAAVVVQVTGSDRLTLSRAIDVRPGEAYGINRALNSESVPELSLDGRAVAAVLLAPGSPTTDQTRTAANRNDPASYLEAENALSDTAYVTAGGPDFNDRVVAIGTDELMTMVANRVGGEVASALRRYRAEERDAGGDVLHERGFPWLSRYTDPGPAFPAAPLDAPDAAVMGPGSAGLVIEDASRDFVALGMARGAAVAVADAGAPARIAYGLVASVEPTALTLRSLAGGLTGVEPGLRYRVARFNGTAPVREGQLPFHEQGEPFATELVVSWSVSENEAGMALSSASGLAGEVAHEAHLRYSAQRTAVSGPIATFEQGQATGGSAGLELEDNTADFAEQGVVPGDRLWNVTDGSSGVVSGVVSPARLRVVSLSGGATNVFSNGDLYQIWPEGRGALCAWSDRTELGEDPVAPEDSVHCFATGDVKPQPLALPPMTAGGESAGRVLAVPTANFVRDGVRPGDLVLNVTDGTAGVIEAIADADPGRLTVREETWSGALLSFDPGDTVEVRIRTLALSGAAEAGTAGLTLVDSTQAFRSDGVAPGDLVVHEANRSVWSVVAVSSQGELGLQLLSGTGELDEGDGYELVGSFFDARDVVRRRYTFNLSYAGDSTTSPPPGGMVRLVQRGSAIPPHPDGLPVIRIDDLDAGGDVLGSAVATWGPEPVAGSIAVGGIHRDFDPDDPEELPPWFAVNGWPRLVYLSMAESVTPFATALGGDATCTVGRCLRVHLAAKDRELPPGVVPRDDVEALVLLAGPALPEQDRSGPADRFSYFESAPGAPAIGNDTPGDDEFVVLARSDQFNDRIRVLAP